MILAGKLISLRKKNGWSQEELADKVNVTRQSVSKWEGAQSVPDLDKILQLAQLFGVSTDYLLKDELGEMDYAEASLETEHPLRRVSLEEANEFLNVKRQTAPRIAFAAFLCILSPICLLLLGAASEIPKYSITESFAGGVGLIIMLLLVAAAVAIFISCGAKTKPYEFLETETFETQYGVTGMVKERQKQYADAYTRSNVLGACICILSLVPLFAGSVFLLRDLHMVAMVCVTLLLAGIGVLFFINAGINWASLQKLLQEGDYSRRNKKVNALADSLGTAYWLLVVAGYLGYSFITDDWTRSWIVFPVAGVLYAAIMAVYGAFRRDN